MSDVTTSEIDWDDAPEVALADVELDEETAPLWRHSLPRSVLLVGMNEGQVLIAAASCPDAELIGRIVESTGATEVDLIRVSDQTLTALHDKLRGR